MSVNRVSIGSDNGLAPNLNQCWVIVIWNLLNKLQWNFNQNTTLFIHEKRIWKYRLRNGGHFVPGGWVNDQQTLCTKFQPLSLCCGHIQNVFRCDSLPFKRTKCFKTIQNLVKIFMHDFIKCFIATLGRRFPDPLLFTNAGYQTVNLVWSKPRHSKTM